MKHPLDIALYNSLRGNFTKAETILREYSALVPEDPRPKFNLGWYELSRGNIHEGFDLLNYGRWCNAFGNPALKAGTPLWNGETGATILFNSEGGLGDQIISIRYVKQLAEHSKVIVACDPSLMPLFSRINGVSAVVASDGARYMYHTHWIPAMSAPFIIGNIPDEPYIPCNLNPIKGRIGVKFFGNPEFSHEEYRQFPKKLLIDLTKKFPNNAWVNLQREGMEIPKWFEQPSLATWDDTIKVLEGLELVITSCTSIAHLSGAMGIPTWVIVPILPYYIWAEPETRWYKTVKIFRQEKFSKWKAPFANITRELQQQNLGM